MPAAPPSAVSRRTLLVGGTSGLAVALLGCTRPEALGGPGSSGSPTPATEPETAPDVTAAAEALDAVRGVRGLVQDVVSAFPGLGAALTPVVAMHSAHELALAGAVPTAPTTPTTPAAPVDPDGGPGSSVPPGRAEALQAALGAEESLREDLVALALRAESGAFAQLLASMAAGVAQRAARWPA